MRKLWNRPASAVWSLSTESNTGVGNMNICTYVTPISMTPKLFAVAVYENTKTLENVTKGGKVLLQLLTEELAPVVRICGKKTGKSIDKISLLQRRFKLEQDGGLYYFSGAAGYTVMEVEQLLKTNGDHQLLIGRVCTVKNLNDNSLLTTDYLKEHNYIR